MNGKELFKRQGDKKAVRFEDLPNTEAVRRYGMTFRNTHTLDGVKTMISAVIDPCRGRTRLCLDQVSKLNEPFGFMNEPPPGTTANCESLSRISLLQSESLGPCPFPSHLTCSQSVPRF